MKILSILIVSAFVGVSMVSAATGSTSTGTTSTGSVSTGSVIHTDSSVRGPGGLIRAWNFTTSQFEMFPQCFPYTYAEQFFLGDVGMIYTNQRACQSKRSIDFKF